MVKTTTSKFVEVECQKCKNEQIIFSKPSGTVKCLVCEETMAEPTGGIANVKAKIKGLLE